VHDGLVDEVAKQGRSVKSTWRDALKLARLTQAKELKSIYVPDERDGQMGELCAPGSLALDRIGPSHL
jgi:transposase